MTEILTGLIIGAGGSLLNFVVTKVYNYATGSSKNFFWRSNTKFLKDLKYKSDFAEIKKRIKIIVIDDENSFPLDLFISEGYLIEEWDKVVDYGKLESGFYDIIVLDIKGVAEHISVDDGLGVLEQLKAVNPSQIIIAYSQHSFDLNKNKFWDLADDKIAKPSDFLKIKSKIDNLISLKFTPSRYINSLYDILQKNNYKDSDIKKFDRKLTKSILNGQKPNWEVLYGFVKNLNVFYQLIPISNTLVKFYQV